MEFSTLAKSLNFSLPIKLSKSNYLLWKTQVFPVIQALDLEEHLLGLSLPTNKFVSVEIVNESGERVIENRISKEFNIWRKVDKILMSWIFSTVSESVIGQLVGCSSSFEVWNKLEKIYSQQSIAKILQLKNQLNSVKKGSDTVSEFVFKIKNIGDCYVRA